LKPAVPVPPVAVPVPPAGTPGEPPSDPLPPLGEPSLQKGKSGWGLMQALVDDPQPGGRATQF
jgi:hypothetical protein